MALSIRGTEARRGDTNRKFTYWAGVRQIYAAVRATAVSNLVRTVLPVQ